MNRILLFAIVVIFSCGCSEVQTYQFMTYNLRYDNPNDGINRWDQRKEYVLDLINNYSPDVFGTQEGLNHQLTYLDSKLDNYSFIGVGRDDGKTKGEYSAIFYKKNKFKVVEQSTFWLSTKPNEISVGWDAVLERICTYGLFEDVKSGKRFWVFNAHFDHVGKVAQLESAKLIVEKISELNTQGDPVLLMGDLNLKPNEEAIQYLSGVLIDSHKFQEGNKTTQGTFNAFKHDQKVTDRIDYIFLGNSDCDLKNFKIIEDKYENRYPSDHLPVYVEVEL